MHRHSVSEGDGHEAECFIPSSQEEEALSGVAVPVSTPAGCQPAGFPGRRSTEHTHIPGLLPAGSKVKRPGIHKHGPLRFLPGSELHLRSSLSDPRADIHKAVVDGDTGIHDGPGARDTCLELVQTGRKRAGVGGGERSYISPFGRNDNVG